MSLRKKNISMYIKYYMLCEIMIILLIEYLNFYLIFESQFYVFISVICELDYIGVIFLIK